MSWAKDRFSLWMKRFLRHRSASFERFIDQHATQTTRNCTLLHLMVRTKVNYFSSGQIGVVFVANRGTKSSVINCLASLLSVKSLLLAEQIKRLTVLYF